MFEGFELLKAERGRLSSLPVHNRGHSSPERNDENREKMDVTWATTAAAAEGVSAGMAGENDLWGEVGEVSRLARELPRALREERDRTSAAVAGWVRALRGKRELDRRLSATVREQRREIARMERGHRAELAQRADECERLRGTIRVMEDARAAEARQAATEISLARARFEERSAQLAISTRQVDQLKRQIAIASSAATTAFGSGSAAGVNHNKRRLEEHDGGNGETSAARTSQAGGGGPAGRAKGKGKGKGKQM